MTVSHTSALFAVKDAKIKRLLTDPGPTVLAITGVTNAGTTVTATVASTTALAVGQTVVISGITGFTTNNPNGTFTVATIVDATHFTYVVSQAPTGAYGSGGSVSAQNTPTFGSTIQVDGIKTLALAPAFKNDTIRGAMRIRASRTVQNDLKATMTFAGLNLDAEAVMFGGTVTDTGTDPTATASYLKLGADQPNLFQIEAQCIAVDTPGGDCHIVLYRCVVDAESLGFADEAHHVFSVGVATMPRTSDDKWYSIVYNAAAVAVA